MAHHLIVAGVRPESLVALCVERSSVMLVMLLAILKAGAACLPLDPDYQTARLGFMLDDAAPTLLLTTAVSAARLGTMVPATCAALRIDDPTLVEALAGAPTGNPTGRERRSPLTPGNPAYVVCTSGSTVSTQFPGEALHGADLRGTRVAQPLVKRAALPLSISVE